MKRKAISKRVRFEIFKRDEFTCRYCGRRPPDVVLVIDHLVPVAAGGLNDPLNLLTSCDDCNSGKGAVPIGESAPRPDADPREQEMRDLELQQELAELRLYQEREAARQVIRQRIVEGLQDDFAAVLQHEWVPGDGLLLQMINKYPVVVVAEAVVATATALNQRRIPGYTNGYGLAWVRYMWGVARNANERLAEERELDEMGDAG